MTDIVKFLTARLDEDEAAAVRAARPEPWVKPQPSRPDWYVQFWADPDDRAAVIADPESSAYPVVASLVYHGEDDEDLAEGRVEHIARHDPARVLAEVAAKRKIVMEYATALHLPDAVFAGAERAAGFQLALEMACRALAAPHANHPDYKPAWRVE